MPITYPVYLVGYQTLVAAENRSHEAAVQMGCSPDDITQYWFAVIKHPNRNEWAMVINESLPEQVPDNLSLLTTEEQALVVPRETVQEDGWFDIPYPPAP